MHFAKQEPYASSTALQKHLNNTYALSLGFSSQACMNLSSLKFTLDERNKNIINANITDLKSRLGSEDSEKHDHAYVSIGRIASLLPDEHYARSIIKDTIDHAYAHDGAKWTEQVSALLQAYEGDPHYPRKLRSIDPSIRTRPAEKPASDAPSVVLE